MRLATWNIGSALNNNVTESIAYIADYVEKNSIDILCLQEIITSGMSIDYISALQKKLSFKDNASYELSSAHIDNNIMMGVAILSRYSIVNSYEIKLTNPDICFNKNGKTVKSDDKGFLVAEIMYKGRIVKIVTGHMLPFHSLGSDSRKYQYLYDEMYAKVKTFCKGKPFVLCGDFNSSKLKHLIKNIYIEMTSVFDEATRYNGKQNDYIFVSKEWKCKGYNIDMNEYDHFLCVGEIELKSTDDLRILHLSDIHYLSDDFSIDEKSKLSNVKESDIRKNLFYKKIIDIKERIDYVIVTGDITTGGRSDGFRQFSTLVQSMQEKDIFPSSNHFLVVPGNHDIGNVDKWKNFIEILNGNFVRPWIENIDKNAQELVSYFGQIFNNEFEDIFGFVEDPITLEKIHFPFILDTNNHILVYGFNSSSISRTKIILDTEDKEIVEKLKKRNSLNHDTKNLLNILEKELIVDPARIDPQELFLFQEFIKIIETKIDLSTFHKIAVLHHHTTTISCSEEIKKFEHITNAGIFKKIISDKNFQIIMHGHKHYADIFYDSAIVNHKKLLVISGGSLFGYSNEKNNGFYLHTLKENILDSEYIYLTDEKKSDRVITKLSGDTDIIQGLTLSQIYKDVEITVIKHINNEIINGQKYVGWSKNIEERKVGVIASVYGILILELLKSNNRYYTQKKNEIIESLWRFRHANGGWGAVSQITTTGAPEATAWVVLALFSINSSLYEQALNDLYKILDRMEEDINSNFTLGLIINILCKVDPDSNVIPIYCEKLLKNAIKEDEKIKFWCSKCKYDYIKKIEPSIVSTACAIIALYNCQEKGIISKDLLSDLSGTREILLNKNLWRNTQEAISVQIENKEDSLIVHYYTIAWVLKALLAMDCFVDYSIIQDAVNNILKDYQQGYWNYDGSFYIWTIYDALTALETYFYKK